jgi:ubiquinone/menaquinone biosynthesis C-methylase UbiE
MHEPPHAHAHAHAHAGPGPALADLVPALGLPEDEGRALDVGCGHGDDARWLHAAGFDTIGVDADPAAVRHAAESTPAGLDIEWVVADATQLPLGAASCSLVTDRGCLHHLPIGARADYALEVARVLTPGGAWLIRDVIGHGHQVDELDEDAIRQLGVAAGLVVESIRRTADAPPCWFVAVLRAAGPVSGVDR